MNLSESFYSSFFFVSASIRLCVYLLEMRWVSHAAATVHALSRIAGIRFVLTILTRIAFKKETRNEEEMQKKISWGAQLMSRQSRWPG